MKVKENDRTCKTCIYHEYWCLTDDDDTSKITRRPTNEYIFF